jgi:hypothetical protein
MEAIQASKMSTTFHQTTRGHIPEESCWREMLSHLFEEISRA